MTEIAWAAMALAGIAAVADWAAVSARRKRVEYVAKPAVMLFLIAAVALMELLEPADPNMKAWFIVALSTSLAGDVFLMLPKDKFVLGLASFLLAHIAYTIAFAMAFERPPAILFAALGGLAVLDVILLRPILSALSKSQPQLRAPVIAYTVAISAMVSSAYATGNWLAAAGATLFMFSDFMIARHRLVRPVAWAPLAIIVTYHLGQAGLVLSLAG
jgi:uncharacterized membrane protein YhhN